MTLKKDQLRKTAELQKLMRDPAAVLALIAENETLTKIFADAPDLPDTDVEWLEKTRLLEAGRDQLKAENEALRNAFRPLLAHWDDLKAGESLNVDAARAAMSKGEQS